MDLISLLLINLVVVLVYMTVWFVVGKKLDRIDVADTAWGGGFILIATVCLVANTNSRSFLLWLLVTLWGLRLASHIWRRNALRGPDKRYAKLSAKWPKDKFWTKAYVSIFVTQAALIYIVSLPIILAGGEEARPLGLLGILAIILWTIGFVFETVADRQLAAFAREPGNKGEIMATGLWKYSRHPNYFGELVQWWAISLVALGPAIGWLGLAGPALLTYLILFVPGIPLIEKRHSQKPGYAEYKKRTSVIIPLPRRH